MGRAALGLAGREEEDDADEGERGPDQLAAPDALVRQQRAERQREHEAERGERLHDDERAAVECRRLHHPTRRLERGARDPHGPVQNLHEKSWIVCRSCGGERALLLQDRAECEQHGRQDGERLTHGQQG